MPDQTTLLLTSTNNLGIPAISADGSVVAVGVNGASLVKYGGAVTGYGMVVINLGNHSVTTINTTIDGKPPSDALIAPSLSSDGSLLSYESQAGNLDAGALLGGTFVTARTYITSTAIAAPTMIMVGSNGYVVPSIGFDKDYISRDGHYTFVAGLSFTFDSNPQLGLFVEDNTTKAIHPVLEVPGTTAGYVSFSSPSASADGNIVAFTASSPTLSYGLYTSLYAMNMSTGELLPVSTTTDGNVYSEVNRFDPSPVAVSADGRYIAFATYLETANHQVDYSHTGVFVKDLKTGSILDAGSDASGNPMQYAGKDISISDDGRYVAFITTAHSDAPIPGVAIDGSHVMVKDLLTGGIANIGLSGTTAWSITAATLSGDGKSLAIVATGYNAYNLYEVPVTGFVTNSDAGKFSANAYTAMTGWGGDDTYTVTSVNDRVVEFLNGGNDTVNASVSHTLSDNVENLVLTGSNAINGTGNALNNHIVGNAAANIISGGAGNDLIEGGGGADTIDAGDGNDTVILTAHAADYNVSLASGLAVFTPKDGTGGTIRVSNAEHIQLDGMRIEYADTGNAGEVFRLYQAAFNRKPDPAGFGFWLTQVDHGASLSTVAAQFAASTEFKGMFPSTMHNVDVVAGFYVNVLHRIPDAAGSAYWTQILDNGASRGDVLMGFSESLENKIAMVGVMHDGYAWVPYG